ncbi:MAG: nitroreductase family protein [Bacillota bacterium]
MEIPHDEWYAAIGKRRSRRRFDSRPVEPELVKRMEAVCDGFRPFAEARALLVARPAHEVVKGVVGNYGQVRGAPAYVAMVGDMGSPYVHERVGYTGEGVVLEATALGLGTCWVGGFFRPEVAGRLLGIRDGERVLAVIPFGYPGGRTWEEAVMTGFARSHRRKPLGEMVDPADESRWPPWAKAALEAARLSPSAVNRQPWHFTVEPDGITVSVSGIGDTWGIARRLDCGIAMLHIEVAALFQGVRGHWEPLPPPCVARFKVRDALR